MKFSFPKIYSFSLWFIPFHHDLFSFPLPILFLRVFSTLLFSLLLVYSLPFRFHKCHWEGFAHCTFRYCTDTLTHLLWSLAYCKQEYGMPTYYRSSTTS